MSGKIGIMGGTFNPIHYGHLFAAEQARYTFSLEEVIFVPSARPPHKDFRVITLPENRYDMVALAISGNPFFKISRIEIDRVGPSYTIDTLIYFKEKLKNKELFFITGADAILEILTWKNTKEIFSLCTVIAATRPEYEVNKYKKLLGEDMAKRVIVMEIPGLSISSTDIRNRVKEGRPIKYLLPPEVENYIYENRLYR